MSSSIATPNEDSTNFCYTGTIPSDRPSGLIKGKNCKVNTLHNRAGVRQKRLGGNVGILPSYTWHIYNNASSFQYLAEGLKYSTLCSTSFLNVSYFCEEHSVRKEVCIVSHVFRCRELAYSPGGGREGYSL